MKNILLTGVFWSNQNKTRVLNFQIANGRSLEIEGEWPWLAMMIQEKSEKYDDAEVQCRGRKPTEIKFQKNSDF